MLPRPLHHPLTTDEVIDFFGTSSGLIVLVDATTAILTLFSLEKLRRQPRYRYEIAGSPPVVAFCGLSRSISCFEIIESCYFHCLCALVPPPRRQIIPRTLAEAPQTPNQDAAVASAVPQVKVYVGLRAASTSEALPQAMRRSCSL